MRYTFHDFDVDFIVKENSSVNAINFTPIPIAASRKVKITYYTEPVHAV